MHWHRGGVVLLLSGFLEERLRELRKNVWSNKVIAGSWSVLALAQGFELV